MKNLKATELKAMARDLGIKGYSDMTKAQLIEAINNVKDVDVIVPEAPEAEANANTLSVEENVPEVAQEPQRKNQKRLITYDGKTQTLTAWAKELGIRHQTLYNRIVMKGWEIERAFEKPMKKVEKVPEKG